MGRLKIQILAKFLGITPTATLQSCTIKGILIHAIDLKLPSRLQLGGF